MYIVADIGGTKTRIAKSGDLEKLGDPLIMETPKNYADGIADIIRACRQMAGNEKIDAMAIDITGVVSDDGKTPLTSPHLPDWRGKPFARELEAALSTTVHLLNDTAQVGLGEAFYGAGKGAHILVYATVSTGVNGVRIVDGVIDPAAYGFEIGGQYLFIGGNPRTLEELVSGKAVQEKYEINPKHIEKDSPVWEELAQTFAYGLHNTILHWSPDRVVLGGSMFNEIGIPVERVKFHLAEIMRKFPSLPEIVHSELGDIGGLWGGIARLKQLR
ncbi:MAG: ROK family protein [Candidatus Pacebacteria bacterium]|nr:ROK family protein [Candidatus Paceibacterota bacterium]